MGIDYVLGCESKKTEADIDIESDTGGEHKQPSHSFKCCVQSSSDMDLTDVRMCCRSHSFNHSTTLTSLTIIYSCGWVDTNPRRKLGHRDVTELTPSQQDEGVIAQPTDIAGTQPSHFLHTHTHTPCGCRSWWKTTMS